MSRAYLAYLSSLFDSTEHSDCTVSFCVEVDGPPAPKRPRTRKSTAQGQADAGRKLIEELPAHQMVLCGGSDRLAALAKEWREEHPLSHHHQPASTSVSGSACLHHHRQPHCPELTVILSSVADLPHARAAVRYIYTGKLPGRASTAELLQLRRQAARLQIKGCVEKCDEAVATRATTTAGVTELHACRHLLPSAAEEPATAALLAACRKQLTRNCGAYIATLQPTALGELLAWLFPDAAAILSDPDTHRQMQALPAPALEALLRCDVFATDNEASVLLMLAYWLQTNSATISGEIRTRLCRLVRLSHLNTPYLHGLLPRVSWFPITREEHQFLCQFVSEPDARRRKSLAAAAAGKYDCSTAWYAAPRRPEARADAGRPYDWAITQEDLAADLDLATHRIPQGLNGAFANGATRLVAHGFEWYPSAIWFNNDGKPEAVLSCAVPGPFASFASAKDVVGVASVSARVVVYRWRESHRSSGGGSSGSTNGVAAATAAAAAVARREEATCKVYDSGEPVSVTSGLAAGAGWRMTVFGRNIDKSQGASARLLPDLLPYLYDGKMSGSLTFV